MEENDNHNQASSNLPTFIDDCAIQLQLGCQSGDIPSSQMFHNVTKRMPVYMPMPIIDQH